MALLTVLAGGCAKDPAFVPSDSAGATDVGADTVADDAASEVSDDAPDAVTPDDATADADAAGPDACTCTPTPCQLGLGCDDGGACQAEDLAPLLFCEDPALESDPEQCDFGLLQPADVCGAAGACQRPAGGPLGSYPLLGEWVLVVNTTPDGATGHTLLGAMTVSNVGELTAHDLGGGPGSQVLAGRFATGTLCVAPDGRVRLSDATGANVYRGFYAAQHGLVAFGGGSDHLLGFLVKGETSALNLSGRYRTVTLDGSADPPRTWAGELEPAEISCAKTVGFDKSDGASDRTWAQTSCAVANGDRVTLVLSELGEAEGAPPIYWTGALTRGGQLFVAAPLSPVGVPHHGLLVALRTLPGHDATDLAGLWSALGRLGPPPIRPLELHVPLGAHPALGAGVTWDATGHASALAPGWYRPDADGGVSLRLGPADDRLGVVGGHTFEEDLIVAWRSRATALDAAVDLDPVPAADASLVLLFKDLR